MLDFDKQLCAGGVELKGYFWSTRLSDVDLWCWIVSRPPLHPLKLNFSPGPATFKKKNLKMAFSLLCSCLTWTRTRKSLLMSSRRCCARLWVCRIWMLTHSSRILMQMVLVSSPSVSSVTFKFCARYWDQMRTTIQFFFYLFFFIRWVPSLCQDSSRVRQAFHHLPGAPEVPGDPGGRFGWFGVCWWDNVRRNEWREHLRQEGGLKLKTIMTFS